MNYTNTGETVSSLVEALERIANVQGPASVNEGVMTFEDGTHLDIGKLLAKPIGQQAIPCTCDLDNWEPDKRTGHSPVCGLHKQALAQAKGSPS